MASNDSAIAHKPTFISYENVRFLIMDAPTNKNVQLYIQVGDVLNDWMGVDILKIGSFSMILNMGWA